jgi:cytochrome c55X
MVRSGLTALALLCIAPAWAWAQTPVDKLVYLVRQDCGSCHGLTLKGGLGPALLPQNLAGKSAEALAAIILDGVPGTPMPPWRGELSPEDARWIAEKLKEGFPQ